MDADNYQPLIQEIREKQTQAGEDVVLEHLKNGSDGEPLVDKICQAKILAGENAVIERLKKLGFSD